MTLGHSKNRFERYCNCGAFMVINNPMVAHEWLETEWNKLHPKGEVHFPLPDKDACMKARKKQQAEARQRREMGCSPME